MVPLHEVADHPKLSLAVTMIRARKKYRHEELREAFREIGSKDELGIARVLYTLTRIWVGG